LKVLGISLINITEKYKPETIKHVEEGLKKFIVNRLPRTLSGRIYREVFFETIIYRDKQHLADLVYRPRRHEIPLERIIKRSSELKTTIEKFTREVEDRITRFQGLE